MNRTLGLVVLAFPALAVAQLELRPVIGPALVGARTAVNDGPGDQTDPHASGDLVAYTHFGSGGGEIRYHDLFVGTDQAVPNNGAFDALSDISGSTIAYTRFTSAANAIFTFDISTNGPPVEVDPRPGSNRRFAAIGGNTVAWQDLGLHQDVVTPEIVAFDRVTGRSTRLTDNLLQDLQPAVSPDGRTVAWTQCSSGVLGCDVWSATFANGQWLTRALTGAGSEDSTPDSNGALVVYASERSGESDIYWQPAQGGAEQRLVLPGRDRNPNISGHLVAFEHYDESAPIPNWDVFLYDLSTNTLYQVTRSEVNESLSDISAGGAGLIRVVYGAPGAADQDVFAFSFLLPPECREEEEDEDEDEEICAHPGARPLLASLTLRRSSGSPEADSLDFDSGSQHGTLCVENEKATAGWIQLNGSRVVEPSSFKRSVKWITRKVTLTSPNTLAARIAGSPGSAYTVRVYGPLPPSCSGNPVDPGALRVAGLTSADLMTVSHPLASAPAYAGSAGAVGCSAAGGATSFAALLGVLGAALRCRRAARRERLGGRC